MNECPSGTAKPCDNPNCKHVRNDDCCCQLLVENLAGGDFITVVGCENEEIIAGVKLRASKTTYVALE